MLSIKFGFCQSGSVPENLLSDFCDWFALMHPIFKADEIIGYHYLIVMGELTLYSPCIGNNVSYRESANC